MTAAEARTRIMGLMFDVATNPDRAVELASYMETLARIIHLNPAENLRHTLTEGIFGICFSHRQVCQGGHQICNAHPRKEVVSLD